MDEGMKRSLAVIAPINHLSMSEDNEMFLALPQYMDRYTYIEFHKQQTVKGKHVTLDNGMLEGHSTVFSKVLDYAREINATEVVLPDTFKEHTSILLPAYISQLSLKDKRDFQFMIVPHSNNNTYDDYTQDWIKCSDIARQHDINFRIGAAYREFGKIEWRLNHAFVNRSNVHWLGCMFQAELSYGEFESMDTSLPFRCANCNYTISNNTEHFDFDMKLNSQQEGLAYTNITYARELVKQTPRKHPSGTT
jgi:hypothetical protein